MSKEKPLKDLVDAMLKAYGLEEQLDERDLIVQWEQTMGKAIAKRTTSIYLRDGKLFITLNSSVLKQELSYASDEIALRLNRGIGKRVVKKVVFK